jgi:iron(III) transport system ATP-binding protein
MLSIKGLEKSYRDGDRVIPVVRGVNLEVADGDIFTLLGPSGCGKTTIIRSLAGLETPDSGDIWLGGRLVYSKAANTNLPVMHRNIGMVFQSYALWPHMTVFENVAFPMRYGPEKLSRLEIKNRVMSALEMVEMQDFANRSAPMLSGGQQQRVALARALVYEPDVLLLDEPMSNLDARLRVQTRSLLRTLIKRVGITTLCVTHDQEEALAFSDHIGVIRNGKILQSGPPKAIYERPSDVEVANFLGEMNFFAATVDQPNGDDRIRLKTDFGMILVSPGPHLPKVKPSSSVFVTIRPHHIVVKGSAGPLEANCFAGTLNGTEFLGSRTRCTIKIGSSNCIAEINQPGLRSDAPVVVELPDEYLGIIPNEA